MNIKNITHITIHGWMVRELHLQGRELLCYALIFGFSQDGESCFSGSRKYIAEWLGCTLPTVDSTLKSLIERGLIQKESSSTNGVVFNKYSAIQLDENFTPYKEILQGCKMVLHDNDNYSIKEEDTNVSPKKDRIDYKKIIDSWNSTCGKIWGCVQKLTDKRKLSIKKIIDGHEITQEELTRLFETLPYADSWLSNPTREHKNWKPDFDWWMSNPNGWFTKALEGKVHTQNPVIFSTIMGGKADAAYMPRGKRIWFNESTESYWTDEMYIEDIYDGYDESTRPDGAVLTLHNGRGRISWSKENNRWLKL